MYPSLEEIDLSKPIYNHGGFIMHENTQTILMFRMTIALKNISYYPCNRVPFPDCTMLISKEQKIILNKIFSKANVEQLDDEYIVAKFRGGISINVLEKESEYLFYITTNCLSTTKGIHLFYVSNENKNNFLENIYEKITKLEEKNKELEQEISLLKTKVDFSPGGSGYLEAKEDFEKLLS